MNPLRLSLLLALLPLCAHAADKPNIVVILADDMGFSDIGPYGGEIKTPTLDALAKGGVKYANFYNSARCCPTRASLMTGLDPHLAGVGWMTGSGPRFNHGPRFPGYRGQLNRDCVTLAEVLSSAGYATLMSGKWHLGKTDPDTFPLQRGFEKFYGFLSGAGNFLKPNPEALLTEGNKPVNDPESTTERPYYTTDAFTDRAIQFVNEEKAGKNRPFFLYLAYNAPHWPLQAHKQEVDQYAGKYMKGWDLLRAERLKRQIESGLIDPSWAMSERSFEPWDSIDPEKQKDLDFRMAHYAAMIDRMDQNIGKLIAQLKANGQYENTLILFLSDNGACQEGGKLGGRTDPFDTKAWKKAPGASASYGEAWANASNTPFRKFKHYTHEGGIATPLIAHWPKGIKANQEWLRDSAYLPDIAPTLYAVAGASYPAAFKGKTMPPLRGISLQPTFDSKPLKREDPIFIEHEENAAIIIGNMKLVGSKVSVPDGPNESNWELYDLTKDRTEQHDLAKSQPELVATMSAKWLAWAKGANVYPRLPARRPTKKAPKANSF